MEELELAVDLAAVTLGECRREGARRHRYAAGNADSGSQDVGEGEGGHGGGGAEKNKFRGKPKTEILSTKSQTNSKFEDRMIETERVIVGNNRP
jgi:hypothetical protein